MKGNVFMAVTIFMVIGSLGVTDGAPTFNLGFPGLKLFAHEMERDHPVIMGLVKTELRHLLRAQGYPKQAPQPDQVLADLTGPFDSHLVISDDLVPNHSELGQGQGGIGTTGGAPEVSQGVEPSTQKPDSDVKDNGEPGQKLARALAKQRHDMALGDNAPAELMTTGNLGVKAENTLSLDGNVGPRSDSASEEVSDEISPMHFIAKRSVDQRKIDDEQRRWNEEMKFVIEQFRIK